MKNVIINTNWNSSENNVSTVYITMMTSWSLHSCMSRFITHVNKTWMNLIKEFSVYFWWNGTCCYIHMNDFSEYAKLETSRLHYQTIFQCPALNKSVFPQYYNDNVKTTYFVKLLFLWNFATIVTIVHK